MNTVSYDERKENLLNAVNRKDPKSVPILANSAQAVVSYAGKTYLEAISDRDLFISSMTRIFDDLYTDCYINMDSYVYPKTNEVMHDMAQMKIGPDGTSVQHIARPSMLPEDYPALIADPDSFRKNVLFPRMYPFMFEEGLDAAKFYMKTFFEEFVYLGGLNEAVDDVLQNKYQLISIISGLYPFDNPLDDIFDAYRGFKGTIMDIRRRKDQLKAACERLWQDIDSLAELADPFPFIGQAPHIPTYLSPKQFEELYWPYEKKVIENVAENGSKSLIMTEGRWMQHYDFFRDVPKDSCIFIVDDDDIFDTYDRIGDFQCLAGGAKLIKLMTESRESNIDYAKKVLDHCAGNGGFIFTTDKAWNSPSDITGNLLEVYNYVHDYGSY